MQVLSFIPDHRIDATNVLIELSIKDYLEIAQFILDNNDYQRRKVIRSNIQDLLKSDLLKGCTIPPIVLAIKNSGIEEDFDYSTFRDEKYVKNVFDTKDMLILDGLQRTYVMLELKKEIATPGQNKITKEESERFLAQIIRAELYIGLKKLGILYRMLTLNTGQTTMSTRHLMEILYLDYFDKEIEGVKLITDKEDVQPQETTAEIRFKEILDGYYSLIEGTEIPLDRADILDNMQTIKDLEKTDEDKKSFKQFISTYKMLIDKLIVLSDGFVFNEEDFKSDELSLSGPPFAKDALSFFRKSQSLTGLGAALNFILSRRNGSLDTIKEEIPKIELIKETGQNLFRVMDKHFDYIRNRSKKVGNDQRFYFKILFQKLFDKEDDCYLKLDLAAEQAYKRVKERIED